MNRKRPDAGPGPDSERGLTLDTDTGPEPDREAATEQTTAPPDRGPDPARALLARARADARTAPRPGARRRRRPGDIVGTRSGSGPDERDPQPFEVAVDRLTVEHGWELDISVHAVLARWPDLVGADLAAHCHPEGFSDGVLVVRAESTAWATQLRLLAPQLASRLNAQVGAGTVRSIVVRGPDAPLWSHGRRSVRGRGPRDTYG